MARGLGIVRAIPRNRNIEALLVLFALGVNAFEIAQIQLSVLEVVNGDFFTYWAPIAVAALVFHLILRFRARNADSLILPLAVLLNGLGVAMIYRLDLAKMADGADDLFAFRQVIWTVFAIAAAAAVVLYVPNHLFLRKYVYVAGAVGLVLLILLGVQLPRARELGPILVFWLASLIVLVLERDLGTSLLFFGLFLVMIYTATGRAIYVAVGLGMFVVSGLMVAQLGGYVQGRIDSWLNPFDQANYDAVGGSYQLVQGMFGLAHGGLVGTGLGGGIPQLVPLAESDFIIASIGEELGLIGLFAVFAVYILFVARGIRIAVNHTDDFSRLLAVGLSFVIALQCFIVIGGVTRVVPLTGLTTPLLAAGGSSLLANWIIIGLLLRISDSVRTESA